jgi:cell fate regulator YaaT (PSP1 superfamily)
MACGSCGTKPGGCKSHGSCGTGSCNRMNVYDWLVNLPLGDAFSSCKVIEVSFNQGSRKEFYRNSTLQYFEMGELITVEGVGGFDVGEVSLSGELVRVQLKKKGVDENNPEIKRVLRRSTERDIEQWKQQKSREKEALIRCRAIARQLNLQMKLAEVEFQADGKKATFYYTADDRVDFREMIKIYAGEFKVKVEMRQIGIRQEAAKVGGIGSCGRELCCATWLTDFKSVTTTAARYQNLSINQTKLSGQCGRLKCCLNYELDTYLDALQHFPDNADTLETTKGVAFLIKKDIFKNLMWYTLPDSTKHYPLTLKRVKEIKDMNRKGERVEELQHLELVGGKPKEIESAFVDLVGQISLKSLEKNDRRRKDQQRQQNRPQGNQPNQQRPQQNRPQQNRPQQQGGNPQEGQNRPQGNQPNQQRPQQQNRPQLNRPQQQGGKPQEGQNRPQGNQSNQQRPQQQNRPQQRPPQNRPPQNKPPDNNPPEKPNE